MVLNNKNMDEKIKVIAKNDKWFAYQRSVARLPEIILSQNVLIRVFRDSGFFAELRLIT